MIQVDRIEREKRRIWSMVRVSYEFENSTPKMISEALNIPENEVQAYFDRRDELSQEPKKRIKK